MSEVMFSSGCVLEAEQVEFADWLDVWAVKEVSWSQPNRSKVYCDGEGEGGQVIRLVYITVLKILRRQNVTF